MADDAEPRARIVEIGGRSQALGGEVLLRLAHPFTVLVGRNAAGKSALVQLIDEFATQSHAARPVFGDGNDKEFVCTAEIAGRQYRYTAASKAISDDHGAKFEFSEECVEVSPGGTQTLWSTDKGAVHGLSTLIMLPPSMGLLAIDPNNLPLEIRPVAAALGRLFLTVMYVPAGLPGSTRRYAPLFTREPATGRIDMRGTGGSPRLDRFALQLMHWHQAKNASFERVREVLRRIGICRSLDVVVYDPDLLFLVIDGHDLDAASDGTLRVIEIVVALEMAAAGALVMIEEPETGIHPGLSDRIMAEIESVAEDLQLIISTHSPRILDRVQAQQLRLVRRNGSTRIDALTPEQVKEVKLFLDHQGTLSDYVFSPDFAGEDDDTEAG